MLHFLTVEFHSFDFNQHLHNRFSRYFRFLGLTGRKPWKHPVKWILHSLYVFSLYVIFTCFIISIVDSLWQRISHTCTCTAGLKINILHLECWILTMYHYLSGVSPLPCVLRTCLVSVAVPLQVPNPRHLVCLQLRSPVWSQPHSSSRHTCSALAQCLLTSRLKVSSPPHIYLRAYSRSLARVQWSWYLCVHSSPHLFM